MDVDSDRSEPPGVAAPLVRPADRGLLFDEFEPGHAVASGWRSVREADVAAFAELSGDDNPLHLDEAFARGTTFRRRIAHGLLVESVASGLAWRTGVFDDTLVAIQEMRLRYVAPVGLEDEVRTVLEVLEREPEPGPRRGWVRLAANVYNRAGDAVIRGEWVVLVHRRLPAARRRKDATP
jgi:acyl dehydratase